MKANGLGLLLRAERVKRNLSQMDLAVASGVSHVTVHRAERSGRMTTETARKFAAALGIKASVLAPSNTNARAEHRASAV